MALCVGQRRSPHKNMVRTDPQPPKDNRISAPALAGQHGHDREQATPKPQAPTPHRKVRFERQCQQKGADHGQAAGPGDGVSGQRTSVVPTDPQEAQQTAQRQSVSEVSEDFPVQRLYAQETVNCQCAQKKPQLTMPLTPRVRPVSREADLEHQGQTRAKKPNVKPAWNRVFMGGSQVG